MLTFASIAVALILAGSDRIPETVKIGVAQLLNVQSGAMGNDMKNDMKNGVQLAPMN